MAVVLAVALVLAAPGGEDLDLLPALERTKPTPAVAEVPFPYWSEIKVAEWLEAERVRVEAEERAERERAEAEAAAVAAYLESERTRARAVVPPAGSGTGTSSSYPGGTNDHLARIRQCESGGNYGAISSGGTYRGAYQFSLSTWAAVGGSGDPAAASPAEQDYRAQILYDTAGPGQWPVCQYR